MIKWTVAGLMLISLTSCGMVGGPVSGVVVDAETRQPIEGAYVVAQWSGSSSVSIAESQTVCIYTDMAKTDEKGRFRIPMWFFQKPGITGQRQNVEIYKPGYLPETGSRSDEYGISTSQSSINERVDYMMAVRGRATCRGNEEPEKNLLALINALYEESKALAGVEYDSNIVEPFLYSKEELIFGYTRAQELRKKRWSSQ